MPEGDPAHPESMQTAPLEQRAAVLQAQQRGAPIGAPMFTQQMAQKGQLQLGAVGAQSMSTPQVAPQPTALDSQLTQALQMDPFYSLRVVQALQQRYPQKRHSHTLGSGR
ncbi:MAG TPA: hypothetical protein VEA80_04865 [Vitreimonas sp.]|uniref:hypothetical protein n=1 Tax=Vitreimonas sp. TaxID=3069702 RepID=UPI002D7290E8|nr:hypothetical protein [Vitreimonas sp.]HYD86783.1 hypothetical protein [Vitreimonas sp.]